MSHVLQIKTAGERDWRDRVDPDDGSDFLDAVHQLLTQPGLGTPTLTLHMEYLRGSQSVDYRLRPLTGAERCIASYEDVVRKNRSAEWDTIREVGFDTTGEVFGEVLDHALDGGFVDLPAGDEDEAWDEALDTFAAAVAPLIDALQRKFRAELEAERTAAQPIEWRPRPARVVCRNTWQPDVPHPGESVAVLSTT